MMGSFCQIQWLGQIEYETSWKLQKELVIKRAANEIPNMLLLAEHPHTYTVGIDGYREHLLIDPDELARRNIPYYQVDRGGSVAYHGPGQLVGYPILDLKDYDYSYHQYITILESVMIRALSSFKIQAFRQPGQRGVWVLPGKVPSFIPRWIETHRHIAKIAAVGVKVNENQITSHGFSINVEPDLGYFDLIIPRGIQSCYITSMRQVLDKPIKIGAVIEPVIQSFCELFRLRPSILNPLPLEDQPVSLAQTGSRAPQTGLERKRGL